MKPKFQTQFAICAIALGVAGASLMARADYSTAVLQQNPVGYWRLNEQTAPSPIPIAVNLGSVGAAGNGNYLDGILRGAPGAIVSEPANTSIKGYGDYKNRMRIPYRPEWNINGPFSVEFWAKPGQTAASTSPGASTTFLSASPNTRSGWLFYQGDTGIATGNGWYFRLYRGASATATRNAAVTMNLDTNSWYHVVGVFDGVNVILYVNGALANSTALADSYRYVTDTTAPMTFGSRSDGASYYGYFPYIGNVDEPAFYTNALSAAQILAHYQAGTNATANYQSTVLADKPAGYWRLSEAGDPAAANLGSLGSAGNGTYIYGATPGTPGPVPATFAGFAADNTAAAISATATGFVQLPPLNLNTNRVTITAWVKAKGAQASYGGVVFSDDESANVAGINIGPNNGSDTGYELGYTWANLSGSYSWDSGLNLPEDQWAFIALAVEPTAATLCLHNGTSFQTNRNALSHPIQAFAISTRIGSDELDPSYTFNGSVDEVAVFNKTLTPGEVYCQYAAGVGNLPPVFLTDLALPPDALYVGDTIYLSVDAGGTPNLGYQWMKGGSPLAGETNSYFTKVATLADAGAYKVVVTNAFGTATSAEVTLTVSPAFQPSINSQASSRTVYSGGTIVLWADVTGGGLRYRWTHAGTNFAYTTATNVLITASSNTAGTYQLFVTNGVGSATSAPVVITVAIPAAGTFADTVLKDKPTAWWRLDEAEGSSTFYDAMGLYDGQWVTPPTLGASGVVKDVPNGAASFSVANRQYGEVPYTPALNTNQFTIEAWVKSTNVTDELCPVASYSSSPSRQGYMFIRTDANAWHFALTPPSQNYVYTYLSPEASFAPGTWTHLALTRSASGYTWYTNGVGTGVYSIDRPLNDHSPFRIGADVPGAGSYNHFFDGIIDEVAYYSYPLAASSVLAHYQAALYGKNSAPSFLALPAAQKVVVGTAATFSGVVGGTTPISLQWSKDGSPIAGATASTLAISSTTFDDAGSYVLTATNAFGATSSPPAVLTIMPPLAFANVTNGLVLHLSFDGDLKDSSGRNNDGTGVGGPQFVPGAIGSQALRVTTLVDSNTSTPTFLSSSYVTLGSPADLVFGSSVNFSLSLWARFTNKIGDLPFIGNAVGSRLNPGYAFTPSYNKGGWSYGLGPNLYIEGEDASINDGNWHHLLFVLDRASYCSTYLDGALVNSTIISGVGSIDTANAVTIGQDPSGTYAEGGSFDLDDLAIWKRLLTPDEVYSIFFVGKTYGRSLDAYGPVTMIVRKAGAQVEIIWQAGTLLQAPSPEGPWTAVPGATAPSYKVAPSQTGAFFRVQL